MKKIILLITMVLVGIPLSISADTIYKWMDENGASKFSNDPPPEHVTEYETSESSTVASPNPQPANQRRSSYDRMVKQAKETSDASRKQREEAAATKATDQKRIREAKQEAQRQAERKRLEAKIENIKKRAVGVGFTNGMKQAQIDALVKEIKNLEKGVEGTTE